MVTQILRQGPTTHEVHLYSGSVEDAKILPFIDLLGHIGQRLINVADHLGINCHFHIQGQVLPYGKVIFLEESKNFLKNVVGEV
ncbi:MAG: hypothetical protein DDT19_02534 [Syntrophomonadaceae bacterium]|nr:hypothetical protein [Bacillota bacterium]